MSTIFKKIIEKEIDADIIYEDEEAGYGGTDPN